MIFWRPRQLPLLRSTQAPLDLPAPPTATVCGFALTLLGWDHCVCKHWWRLMVVLHHYYVLRNQWIWVLPVDTRNIFLLSSHYPISLVSIDEPCNPSCGNLHLFYVSDLSDVINTNLL